MDQISTKQVQELDGLNAYTDRMNFGSIIRDMITAINGGITPSDFLIETGTPVNARYARRALTFAGVVAAGDTLTIDNPAVAGTDIYEFVSNAAKTVSTEGNIAVDIEASTEKAIGTLTMDTQPTSGDTMTLGTKVYIFVPAGTATADGEVSIGTGLATAQTGLVEAINGTDGVNTPHPEISAGAFVTDACVLTAINGGAEANLLATTETFTAGTNVFAAATLLGGTSCSATNAAIALTTAVGATATQGAGVSRTDAVLTFYAEVSGVAGNSISLTEDITNATFSDGTTVTMTTGLDGTVGVAGQVLFDATYLYVCTADNTIVDENWRRIAVGSAY